MYLNSVSTEVSDGKEIIDTRKWPAASGVTIELCAGIVDKDESLEKIAQTEVLEECGYSVPLKALKKVTSFR